MASRSKPSIFLSHSGSQKPFTEQLYYELFHVNHRPFFDQDPDYSLPKCEEFPKLIEEACRECKMGVVVLSHEYIESFWPMQELEQLVFHNPSAHIYPLFFKLSPGDLKSEENQRRWQGKWDEISSSHHRHDISKWPQALERLTILGGEVFQPKTSQHEYIQRIVTNICKKVPPPSRNYLGGDDFIQGKERMAKIIAARFKEEEESSEHHGANIFMGVHGVGGSGKSTLCKNMADFYNASDEYVGKSWCLELPSDGDEKKVVEELKKVLRRARANIDNIDNVNQAVDLLKEHMREHKVFLAIDNVWEGAYESACKIMKVHFTQGSKILVTSRSSGLLKEILPCHDGVMKWFVMPIPSITEEEALEALIFYGGHSVSRVSRDELIKVVRWCSFEGQCHPLLLKAMGSKLRPVAGRMDSAGIARLLSSATNIDADKELEKAVLSVLKTSYDDIPDPRLQKIFLDLQFLDLRSSEKIFLDVQFFDLRSSHHHYYYDEKPYWYTLAEHCEWLSMLYEGLTGDGIRDELIKLEYYGLLELDDQAWLRQKQIRIHDLYRDVSRAEVLASGKYLVVNGPSKLETQKMDWSKLERIWMGGSCSPNVLTTILHNLQKCFRAELLHVSSNSWRQGHMSFSLKRMEALRVLEIVGFGATTVKGWNQASNLVSVRHDCSDLVDVSSLSTLTTLQNLHLQLMRLERFPVVNLSSLKILDLSFSKRLRAITGLQALTNLCRLELSCCSSLQSISSFEGLTNLKEIILDGCSSLQAISGFEGLTNLRELHLDGCSSLQVISGFEGLTNMKELNLEGCSSLQKISGVEGLTNLKKLNLEGCSSLTGINLEGCSSLEEIEGVEGLTNLTCLDLEGCSSLQAISCVEGLTNLAELNLGGCCSMTRLYLAGFSSLEAISGVEGLTNLKELHLEGCSSLQAISG